ncbi:hypothetical protein SAMN02745166_02478 [Prosthecobacter debontii]|uniref:DUF4468 domain-containing protein n=1 Tax=Prosthecobacter debontii TaxID=48467 RepID=A0A1T4Y6H9_9BACT|nr:hypothetical protein SAMN02745166_02478 [Prosthecobacter debontii]
MHHAGPVKFIFHVLLLLALSALAGAAWVAHRPVAVAPLEAPKPGPRVREFVDDLKQAAIKRSAIFEISEGELNRHLAKVLTAKMTPPADRWVKFERLAFELEPDLAHATLVWDVQGHTSTATVDFRIRRLEDVFRVEVVGGSYGHLVVPRGMLRPLSPALEKLADVLKEEIQALFQMNQIQLAQDKLVIDPRFP